MQMRLYVGDVHHAARMRRRDGCNPRANDVYNDAPGAATVQLPVPPAG